MTEIESPIVVEQIKGKANILLDMSKFDLFQLCQTRYDYRHNRNLVQPIHQKSKALDHGGVAHEGFEIYYKLLQQGIHYNDRMQACLMKIRQVGSDPNQSNLEPEELATVLKAVEESCDFWRHEDEHLEILEVERSFAYVLYEDDYVRIIISGKIDLLVNKLAHGHGADYLGLPMDHKTYSRDGEVLELSNQFENYCVATNSHYLVVNRVGLQKTVEASKKFKRIPLSYDHLMLEEWKENTKNVILDEYLNCVATGRWKMNFTSCLKFNRRCEYYEVCRSSGPKAKEWKLATNFVVGPEWDVTAKLEGEE